MIRVVLPQHLRTLTGVEGEVSLDAPEPATTKAVLDALEEQYPVLREPGFGAEEGGDCGHPDDVTTGLQVVRLERQREALHGLLT